MMCGMWFDMDMTTNTAHWAKSTSTFAGILLASSHDPLDPRRTFIRVRKEDGGYTIEISIYSRLVKTEWFRRQADAKALGEAVVRGMNELHECRDHFDAIAAFETRFHGWAMGAAS